MKKDIHLCCYSSHNSLQIDCDLSWTTAKWGSPSEVDTGIKDVYLSDDDRHYTFNESKVTCTKCKLSIRK